MSLLDSPTPLSPAQTRANRARALPRTILHRLLRTWGDGLDLIWNTPNPAEVLAALGTNAGELFRRSAELRAFLESQKAGCTNIPQSARIKATVINPDGTVTLRES